MKDILSLFGHYQKNLYSAVLTDVLDSMGHRSSALPSNIRPLRPEWKILGRATTLCAVGVQELPERPYAMELAAIDELKPGDVLVATTQGDYGSSLWGELLSTAALARGARGVVIDGMTRDVAKIIEMDLPLFAVGFHPLDSKGRLECINRDRPIQLGLCWVRPGDWIFGDIDGLVVVPAESAHQAFSLALEKIKGENKVRLELAKGRSAQEVFNEYGIL